MQDKEYGQIAAALRELTGIDGVYKVIEADEILEKLPAGSRPDKQRLSTLIRDLRDMNYLEVKYLTPDEYCLLTSRRLDELIAPAEEKVRAEQPAAAVPAKREEPAAKERPKLGARLFLIAFSGSMLGGMIVAALAVILQKFAL